MIKAELQEVIREFNRGNDSVKAELSDSAVNHVKIIFSGPYCTRCNDYEEFPIFLKLLEAKLKQPVSVKECIRTGHDSHRVVYIIGEEDPAGKILKILQQYEEGVPAHKDEFED